MTDLVADILSWGLLLTGSVFAVVGGIGIHRMPDFFTRMHAAGVTDTMGAGLLLGGLMIQGGLTLVTVKLVLILLFLLFTSPTSSHAVANAAFHSGLAPKLDDGPAEETAKKSAGEPS